MSISLSIIERKDQERKVDINKVIQNYFKALNLSHTKTELDGGYVYKEGIGCLSFITSHKYIKFQSGNDFSEKEHVFKNKKIYEYKIIHKNSEESRKNILNKISSWGKLESNFIFLEQTGMRSDINNRPPWKTKNGNLFFSVGFIGHYFDKKLQPKIYPNTDQGVKFMEKNLTKDKTRQQIINDFFSQFIDPDDNLEKLGKTGMIHFTNIIKKDNDKLKAIFVQGKTNIARYFFQPDIVFSSNESVLRIFRHLHYPNIDTPIRKQLKKMDVEIISD